MNFFKTSLLIFFFFASSINCMEEGDTESVIIESNETEEQKLPNEVIYYILEQKLEDILKNNNYKTTVEEFRLFIIPLTSANKFFFFIRTELLEKFVRCIADKLFIQSISLDEAANRLIHILNAITKNGDFKNKLMVICAKSIEETIANDKLKHVNRFKDPSNKLIYTFFIKCTENQKKFNLHESESPNILPTEIWLIIFNYANLIRRDVPRDYLVDIASITSTCKSFYNLKADIMRHLKDATVKLWMNPQLSKAASANQINLCSILLCCENIDINKISLILLLRFGFYNLAKLFIEKGINLNRIDTLLLDVYDTPLTFTISEGKKKLAKLIIKNGADVNLANDFNSPLVLSLINGFEDLAILLIEKGANVYTLSYYEETPLRIAEEKGMVNVVRLIKEKLEAENIKT